MIYSTGGRITVQVSFPPGILFPNGQEDRREIFFPVEGWMKEMYAAWRQSLGAVPALPYSLSPLIVAPSPRGCAECILS